LIEQAFSEARPRLLYDGEVDELRRPLGGWL